MRARALLLMLVLGLLALAGHGRQLTARDVAAAARDVAQAAPGSESLSRLRFVAPEKRWAVVIGVSRYEYLAKGAWLDSGDKDAAAFAEFLQSPRGGSLPDDHLKLLLNEQATTRNIRLALDFLIKNVAPGDVATIFFAGHGQVEQLGSGEVGYLLPYDSDPAVLSATALPMDEVARYVDFHLAQASQVVLVTDACHSGGLASDDPLGLGGRRKRSVNDVLQDVGQREGVLNITACRRDEVAVEDPRLGGHGVLTYCLLRALNGGGSATEGGIVRAAELLEFVVRQVPRLTDGEQHPRHGVNFTDEFPLANLNLEGPDYQVPEAPQDVLAASTDRQVFASRARADLKIYGAPAGVELYLVAGEEQRSLGRALSSSSVLVAEGLPQALICWCRARTARPRPGISAWRPAASPSTSARAPFGSVLGREISPKVSSMSSSLQGCRPRSISLTSPSCSPQTKILRSMMMSSPS